MELAIESETKLGLKGAADSDAGRMEELVRRGEELELEEKGYGVWQSVGMNKMALVYSRFRLKLSEMTC
jgi:hypothetical protein